MVQLQLEAIAFNHDPYSAVKDALNIRRNAAQAVIVPEWRRGFSFEPEDSIAAYAIRETLGHTITIQAKFSINDSLRRRVEVRAVQERPLSEWPSGVALRFPALTTPYAHPCSYWPFDPTGWPTQNLRCVLGEVKAQEVEFQANGETEFAIFDLQGDMLQEYGVGTHRVVWWWQFRCHDAEPWRTFAVSRHKIYTVLGLPRNPWEQENSSVNTQLPWAEVLDFACQWARGAIDLDRAAVRVTEAVYQLGAETVEYNCPNLGAPMYVTPDLFALPHSFHCTAFLDRLNGGIGFGRYVNCSDCAAIVSTFANILGCDLWQSRMGLFPQGFSTNPMIALGSKQWSQPCGSWPGFGMHEVAWTGDCGEEDEVFDACLAVDVDLDPTKPPHVAALPANMRFGRPGQGYYRDRLAAPPARPDCQPWPVTRQRRLVV